MNYKELALIEKGLNDEQLENLCPIHVFKYKGDGFLQKILCDESCYKCWDREVSKEIWMYQIGESDIWTSNEEFDTKEAAIEAGKKEVSNYDYKHFYIGQKIDEVIAYGVDVDGILEGISLSVYDEIGPSLLKNYT
jgi:hypothetical protein